MYLCSQFYMWQIAVKRKIGRSFDNLFRARGLCSLKRVRFISGSAAMTMREALTADSAIALVQQYLRKEKLHWQPCKYALQGDEITSVQRNHTVKWLTVISRYLKFTPETLFLSVTLMDEFLRLVRARPKYLKCIAISCFYLASKIIEEDEVVPHIKDLITNSNCNFSVSEITRMEAVILKKLKWDLCRATALDFLHGFHALLVLNRGLFLPDQSAEQLAALGPLLETKLEICLDQNSLLATRPSTVALALVSLELETWTRNWFVITIALQRLAQVENSDVIRCREELACIFTTARTAVSRKHRHSDSQSASKPSKRKMDNMDIEEIYDSIKKLYGDEGGVAATGSFCGMQQGHSTLDMAGFPVHAM
ncbi:cyclin-I isoform X1 [Ixodes scapularis]